MAMQMMGVVDSGIKSSKREPMLNYSVFSRASDAEALHNTTDIATSRQGAEAESFEACGQTWTYGDVVYWSRMPDKESHIACASARDSATVGICRGDGKGHTHFSFCQSPPAGMCAGLNGNLWFVFCNDLLRPTEAPTASPTASPTVEPTAAPTAAPTATPTAGPTSAPTATPTASPTHAPILENSQIYDPPAATDPPPASGPTYDPPPAAGPTHDSPQAEGSTGAASAPGTQVGVLPPEMNMPIPVHDFDPYNDNADVKDDPHVNNLRNERFDIRKPSEYLLLRVPLDEQLPAAMELTAGVAADGITECGVYVKNVTFRGTWFNGQTVRIRPHTRNVAGSNQAGDQTRTNFSLQVSEQQVSQPRWRSFSFEEAGSIISEASTGQVGARFFMREEFGKRLEGQALEFRMGEAAGASVVVSQAAHQALNIEMRHLSKLGADRMGGLLGTESHDREVEEDTYECKMEVAKRQPNMRISHDDVSEKMRRRVREGRESSVLKVSWF